MQVDESVRDLRPDGPAALDRRLRRHPDGPADQGAARPASRSSSRRPGRLLDLVGQKVANLGQVEILVLDEADRMLDMGFLPDIQKIIALLPAEAPEPDVLGDVLGRHPAAVGHDPARPGHGRGRAAQRHGRDRQAAGLPGRSRPQGGAARPPRSARTTCARCSSSRAPSWPRAGSPRGSTATDSTRSRSTRDRSQPERTRALEGFKSGEIRVLVATDVAARGLDIEDLPVVVNFELPWNPQDYIHRIGRTGRAGATGRGDLARVHGRGRPAARHPADAQGGHPVDRRGRLRPGSDGRGTTAVDARGPCPARLRSTTPTASPCGRRVGSAAAGAASSSVVAACSGATAGSASTDTLGDRRRTPALSVGGEQVRLVHLGAREEEAQHDVWP